MIEKDYQKKRNEILERMLWVGDKNSEEGFKLMKELNQLNKEFIEEEKKNVQKTNS